MRKLISFVCLATAAAALLYLASCGRSQELVSITVQPGTETFGAANIPVNLDAGLEVQLQALGTYIHPPVTKDITDKVTWATNSPQMFTISNTGMLTVTGAECGGAIVSATLVTNSSAGGVSSSGAAVIGYMNANVTCFTGNGAGGGPAVTVTFAGAGSGTVTFSPGAIVCSSLCAYQFPAGTMLTLTANPTAPSTTGIWGGTCPSTTATNVCTFTLEANTTVTASFS